VKCLLVDDHAILRDALALLISVRHPEVELRCAASLAEAMQRLSREPDIELVLLDLALPDSQGMATLTGMREAAPLARVIVLSADERRETVMAAIEFGAAGFIPKTADAGVLEHALATVLEGGIFVPPPALMATEWPPSVPGDACKLGLTPRQLEVLRLLVDGQSNKLIGRRLGLAPSTVRTHVEALFERLGVGNRTQAVVAAARLGLRL
jgi:DNA-binding NarL/FixJ family response regulator